jgi:hypothetical protein
MSQPELFRFITSLLPAWRKTRRVVLALGAQGLLRRRRVTLTAIARGVDSRTRILHRVKRLWRFTNNPAVDPGHLSAALCQQAFRLRPEGWVPMVFDETGLKDRAMLLGAAFPYLGRALPLALYAYHPQLLRRSLGALREGLLVLLLKALTPQQRARLLLLGDRGYAASHFFRRLLKARIAFCIRVPRRVLLHMAHHTYRLEQLAADLNPGDHIFLQDVSYGPAKAKLNLVLWWDADQREPWLLATTLPSAPEAVRYYRLRMRVEQLFKDFKHTFALEACQLQTLNRLTRTSLFLLVALWALALLVRYPPNWLDYITARGKLSFLSLALEWLEAPPSVRHRLRQEARSG